MFSISCWLALPRATPLVGVPSSVQSDPKGGLQNMIICDVFQSSKRNSSSHTAVAPGRSVKRSVSLVTTQEWAAYALPLGEVFQVCVRFHQQLMQLHHSDTPHCTSKNASGWSAGQRAGVTCVGTNEELLHFLLRIKEEKKPFSQWDRLFHFNIASFWGKKFKRGFAFPPLFHFLFTPCHLFLIFKVATGYLLYVIRFFLWFKRKTFLIIQIRPESVCLKES